MTRIGDVLLGAFAGRSPTEPPRGVTGEAWQEGHREAVRRSRRARLEPLYDAASTIGYLGYGALVILLILGAAVLIGWWFDL